VKSYRLSDSADEDLLSIFLYTVKKWGEEQVPIYLGRLNQAFAMLAEDPFAVRSRAREDLATRCRIFKVGHHIIFYRPEKDHISIACILHRSMDFEKHVSERHFP
jgi:toxin ParE1/3/4